MNQRENLCPLNTTHHQTMEIKLNILSTEYILELLDLHLHHLLVGQD